MKSNGKSQGGSTMNSAATIHNTVTTIDSKKPNTKQELIAANIKLLIEQLEAGRSDALTNYLTAMSRFHNYSFGNVLEIARQMPTATRVAAAPSKQAPKAFASLLPSSVFVARRTRMPTRTLRSRTSACC
jgi:hypothetical protein